MLRKNRIALFLLAIATVRGENLIPSPSKPIETMVEIKAWKRSLAPFAASQALDVTSSWGRRELNPVLAGGDGRFGAKAAGVKAGAAVAIIGVEYLIARKHPKAASVLAKLNWSSAVVTSAFAAHNFALR